MNQTFAADPETLVALIPCPWSTRPGHELAEIHAETWFEEIEIALSEDARDDEAGVLAAGVITFAEDAHVSAQLVVERPITELAELAGSSAEPLTATEAVMLRDHDSIWRIQIPAGRRLGSRAAKRMSQLMATFAEAGACAVFMPALVRLHGMRFVRKQTMDLFAPEGRANLFVGAWHDQGWMRTRGLTAFGLPEVETPTEGQGLNGAYFLLMDVAANMLMQMASYPDGATLENGHKTYRVFDGARSGQSDEDVPINGSFGIQSVLP